MNKPFTVESCYFESPSGMTLRYFQNNQPDSTHTLLFIHGIGGDATAWYDAQKICFEKGINTLAVDLHGHGLSDKPNNADGYEIERVSTDIVELIETLGLSNVIVVGHSFGGMITLSLAKRKPPKVKGLVLISTNHHPILPGLSVKATTYFANILRGIASILPQGKKRVRPSYKKFINTQDIHLTRLISDIHSTSLKSFLYSYSHLFKYDETASLREIDVPTLVLCGEKDIIFPPGISKKLSILIKHSTYATIPDTNHIIVLSKPKEVMEKVVEFIGTVPL